LRTAVETLVGAVISMPIALPVQLKSITNPGSTLDVR
jgi:hypothetical protein